MNYVRLALIFLQRKKNTSKTKFITLSSIGLILFSILGYLADRYLGWNFWFNTLRVIISMPISISIVTLIYMLLPTFKREKDVIYNLRINLSQRQRINMSLILTFIFIVLNIIIVKPGSTIFTFSGAIFFSIFFSLIAFIRPTHEEFKRYKANIEDERDVLE